MRHINTTGFITAAIFLMFLAACGGSGDGPTSNPPPSSVTIGITPPETSLKLGGTVIFRVTPVNTNWRLTDITAGFGCAANVDNTVRCEPTTPGVYKITVTSTADSNKKATAQMTVLDITEIEPPVRAGITDNAPVGMNSSGKVIVQQYNANNKMKVCLYDGDSCEPIEPPDTGATANVYVFGINDTGDILGLYDKGYFLKTGDGYKVLGEYQDADYTGYTGINDVGELIGYYTDSNGYSHGFIYDGSSFIRIDDPSAVDNSGCVTEQECGTFFMGLNNSGQAVGYYKNADGVSHGFIYKADGTYILLEHPDAGPDNPINVYVMEINNLGQAVGYSYDADGYASGFLYDDTLIEINHPDASDEGKGTFITGITNNGQAIGWYDAGGSRQGFLLENMF